MRKALIVGVDYYTNFKLLRGCVADARAVAGILERHANGEVNFKNLRLLAAPVRARLRRDRATVVRGGYR